ncbi:hypothetical protein K491DRAFT_282313 [Lophiostoma macrostomum CBS 122681]|uniref:CFEM domain-containing protein n=1 Tax=Lophiostoma macrostomum CBS 122681 TaxID=1314788 RepID=A0A6A6TQ21_9PLEO|nr:hypothetical protein K491DRAFT_282313 [Lophiostoma macrostomum CBS 122681]
MKSLRIRGTTLAALLFSISCIAAQSLPACAQSCIGITKTKCKSTDFACACSDEKYIRKLTTCIANSCDTGLAAQAHEYLADLCQAVGSPLEDPEQEQIEIRANVITTITVSGAAVASLVERQDVSDFSSFESFSDQPDSFSDSATAFTTETGISGTATASKGLPPVSTPSSASGSTSTSTGDNGNNDNGGGGGGGGLSTGAKVGIGLGVPLGVIILGGLVGLAFWLGRRSRNKAATGRSEQPHMAEPAELDPNARFKGHEMPTKAGNTAEMPAQVPQAYGQGYPNTGWKDGQPQYAQPVQQQYNPAELPNTMSPTR